MKSNNLPKSIVLFVTFSTLFFPISVLAEDLNSDHYKIIDATTNSTGEVIKSATGNYNVLTTIGDFSSDPRIYSQSYSIGKSPIEAFIANVPVITCFETQSNSASKCQNVPQYVKDNGMVRVCGKDGCYNRAHFEFDTRSNPIDTLYAVQISTDNFQNNINYISGSTNRPINAAERTIGDYKTKNDWESQLFNIQGLESNKQYWIRITALHGDFTESKPSPSVTATTSRAIMNFDLDIADVNGITAETAPNYQIQFTGDNRIIKTAPTRTSSQLIWMDVNSNSENGVTVIQAGKNGGLKSSLYTIVSNNADLNSAPEGFGLQNYYTEQKFNYSSAQGDLGTLTPTANYSGTGNIVGRVANSFLKVYETDKPIWDGRASLQVKAKASSSAATGTDYSEEITFVIVARY